MMNLEDKCSIENGRLNPWQRRGRNDLEKTKVPNKTKRGTTERMVVLSFPGVEITGRNGNYLKS